MATQNAPEEIALRCPRCGNRGTVPRLDRGQIWGCTACGKWLFVDRQGRVYARVRPSRQDPRAQITLVVNCPQCGAPSKVTALQLQHLLKCHRCGEPVWVSPDGQWIGGLAARLAYERHQKKHPRGSITDAGAENASGLQAQGSCRKALPLPKCYARLLLTLVAAAISWVAATRVFRQSNHKADATEPMQPAIEVVEALLADDRQRAIDCVERGHEDAFDAWWRLSRARLSAAFGTPLRGNIVEAHFLPAAPNEGHVAVRIKIKGRLMEELIAVRKSSTGWRCFFPPPAREAP
jgi:ribosomal protein L37AE/L43A